MNQTRISNHPRVIIIGAGFGGLKAARILSSSNVEVLLLDRNNYHTFLPLLYQVAAAELEPEDIAYPVRSVIRRYPRVKFCMADVRSIDFDHRIVRANGNDLAYDYLILGLGSTNNFFGVPGAAQFAWPLKTMEDGIALRNRILSCFELAAHERDHSRRRRLLSMVIVGGGPTGIEFAGAIGELVRGPLVRDFPTLNIRDVHIVLLESQGELLPDLPAGLSRYARRRLQLMGIDVRINSAVREVSPHAVLLSDGSSLECDTVVWTAGVLGAAPVQSWPLRLTRNGRVDVLPSLQSEHHPNVYIIGDLAAIDQNGKPLPMLAPVALQEGESAARNILRQIAGLAPLPFRYRDPGTMITIGRNAAVVRVKGLSLTGFPAWLIWLGVHIFKLIGFRNRLVVLINWAWDYLFFERAVRLIFPVDDRLRPADPGPPRMPAEYPLTEREKAGSRR